MDAEADDEARQADADQRSRRQRAPEDSESRASDDELGLDQFEAEPSDEGLSLEELSRAYAEALGSGEEPWEEQTEQEEAEDEPDDPDSAAADDAEETGAGGPSEHAAEDSDRRDRSGSQTDPCEVTPKSILESILFVGHPENRPLTSRGIAALMRGVRPAEIDELVMELNEEYDAEHAPYWIRSIEAGYVLQLRPQYESVRDAFYGKVKAAKLSQAAIDVLAIVAYNQPIDRQRVDQLRNRPSGPLLNQLVRRGLLKIERDEENHRIRRYHTTNRFLELFQLTSLNELPRSQEL